VNASGKKTRESGQGTKKKTRGSVGLLCLLNAKCASFFPASLQAKTPLKRGRERDFRMDCWLRI
jgi:hypothetical protein